MQHNGKKKVVAMQLERGSFDCAGAPTGIERTFACQLAISVWLRELGDEHALKALSDYVKARCRSGGARARLRTALESEYQYCRERLDLCS